MTRQEKIINNDGGKIEVMLDRSVLNNRLGREITDTEWNNWVYEIEDVLNGCYYTSHGVFLDNTDLGLYHKEIHGNISFS